VSLRLSVTVIALNSLLGAILVLLAAPHLAGTVGSALEPLLLVLPFGFVLSGLWSTATAWAVRENALGPLSAARFLQPASMTLLQVIFGLMHLPARSLVLAHLASHVIYATCIFARTLSADDLRVMARHSLATLARRAVSDRRFPLYVMPAFLMTTMIANAPPLLMGSVFGASVAGQYGVAYRVVTGPLAVICLPLGNLFTSEVSQAISAVRARTAVRFVLSLSLIVVALPVLLFGTVAPHLCEALLGAQWAPAGQIMTALAVMGAAQALASPFGEVPSIYHCQEVRLLVDTIQLVLFFLPLGYGSLAGWDALATIRLMAAGGAGGYLLSAAASLLIMRNAMRRLECVGQGT
jgi:O-antigen/teichoic acid export membrane protein